MGRLSTLNLALPAVHARALWASRVAWRGVAWRGVAWRGVAWRGVAWRGAIGPRKHACPLHAPPNELSARESCGLHAARPRVDAATPRLPLPDVLTHQVAAGGDG